MKQAILVLKNADQAIELAGDYFGADQGALRVLAWNKPLVAAIGDFDSVTEDELAMIQNQAKTVIHLNCHKDNSDADEAIQYILQLGYTDILIWGGLDGRFDHTYANLQLLQRYPQLTWMNPRNRLRILQPGNHHLIKEGYQYCSFFALEEGEITLENVEYPLHQYFMTPLDSLGLSNEMKTESCDVFCTMSVLCVQCHD